MTSKFYPEDTETKSKMDELFELLSHIDIDHERELEGPYNFSRLRGIHKSMHDTRDWEHTHGKEVEAG